jgi:DNA mismatch repair protein MutS2
VKNQELGAKSQKLKANSQKPGKDRHETKSDKQKLPLSTGDYVKMKGQDVAGEIIDISGNTATVAFNNIIIKAELSRLNKIESDISEITKPDYTKSSTPLYNDLNTRMANFKLSIDLRGKRGEQAIYEVKKYLDEAILLNIPEVKILHGKGDGILRQLIRDFLKTLPEVKHFEDEHIKHGGHGITIVRL